MTIRSLRLLLLIILPASLVAQPSYKPLIDSSAACNPSRGHFFIVEEMPSPILPWDEIENLLNQNVQFTNEGQNNENYIYVQCMVNCKGNPGDYQLTQCPDALLDVGNQIIEVFRNETIEWKPGKQRGKTVDVFLVFQIKALNGKFKIEVLI